MKIIKNTLLMTMMIAVFSISAKQMVKPNAVVLPRPIVQPIVQPVVQPMPVVPRPIIQSQVSPVKPVVQQPIKKVETLYHLVPTNSNILRQYDLCPLFGKSGGLYPIFNPTARTSSSKVEARMEWEEVAQNVPCMVALGKYGHWNRTLLQLKSLDQFALARATGLNPALCAGHSLNNGRLMRDYALTGNMQDLKDLHNMQQSANFLIDLTIGAWLNAEVVREKIIELRDVLGVDGFDASALSTVCLFDSHLANKSEFILFSPEEFKYAQEVKKNIRQGLQQDNYIHVMIIGNEEIVEEALGHYFCFVIIKVDNEIQYIVLDTVPSAYHLQPGSHSMDRLIFVIQNIEEGSSKINLTNIRVHSLRRNEEIVKEEERQREEQRKELR